jgi:hypothetical protein
MTKSSEPASGGARILQTETMVRVTRMLVRPSSVFLSAQVQESQLGSSGAEEVLQLRLRLREGQT